LKHEINGKAFEIALNRFVEVPSFHAVEGGQIAVQHHPLTANQEDRLLNLFRLNQGFRVAHGTHPMFMLGIVCEFVACREFEKRRGEASSSRKGMKRRSRFSGSRKRKLRLPHVPASNCAQSDPNAQKKG
jgi:hypothetical protein